MDLAVDEIMLSLFEVKAVVIFLNSLKFEDYFMLYYVVVTSEHTSNVVLNDKHCC